MKKYIVIVAIVAMSNFIYAQNIENKKWELNKYYSFTPEIKDSITVLFEKDKLDNKVNYTGFTTQFDATTCSRFFKDDETVKMVEPWEFSKNKDSITVGGDKFFIEQLTDNDFVVSSTYYYFDMTDYKALSTKEYYVFKTEASLGVDKGDYVVNNKFTIYPNPTKNKLTVVIKDFTATKAEIYSLDGKLLSTNVFAIKQEEHELLLPSLLKGFYILKLINNDDKVIGTKNILIE